MNFFSKLITVIVITSCVLLAVAKDAGIELSGDLIQGGLVHGRVIPGAKVHINGHPVRVSPKGEFILGFGRDYPAQAPLTVNLPNGAKRTHTLNIASRTYAIQRIDGLPDKKVSPDEEALQRIHEEAQAIAAARSRDDDRMDFKAGFVWPVKGPISGVYGSQRVLNGHARRPHFGIDIAAPVGTPVIAPAPGTVSYVNEDMYFSGGTLVLDHGHHLSSSFLHLHKILVKAGDYVKRGQAIALVGATGRVTGAHLDWRMNWHQQRLDPDLLMPDLPDQNE